jgi:hypothetical protein
MDELLDMDERDLPPLMAMLSKSGVKPLHMARLQRSIEGLKMAQFQMGHDSDDIGSVQDSDSVGFACVLIFFILSLFCLDPVFSMTD